MIGAAYLHLRAQIGTGLFSLLRLASEAGAGENTQAALQFAQASLREPFTFIALGPAGSGKSTLLNTLFEREFCGAVEPSTTGKLAMFSHQAEPGEVALSDRVVECRRPHIFLRDFTLFDAPGFDLPESTLAADLAPFLPRADLIFFIVAANLSSGEPWSFLQGLEREALKRLVFVVWQNDRVLPDEGAGAVKRLRQAMLRHLGQACPIFAASTQDQTGREKLARWIENEIIFSEPRLARFREIGRTVHEAMRQIAAQPRAAAQARQREAEALQRLRARLAEREEQSQRQIAGMLWILVQSFDALRQRAENLLGPLLSLRDVACGRSKWPEAFVREIETQAHESLSAQLKGTLLAIEADLQNAAAEHRREFCEAFKGSAPREPPPFSHATTAGILAQFDAPLNLPQTLTAATGQTARTLRMPLYGALTAVVVAVGSGLVLGWTIGGAALAVGTVVFTLLLALLLRRNVITGFGRNFSANRTAVLTAIEAPLRLAIEEFYAQLIPALDARAADLGVRRERQEPLLARLRQLEETFARLEADLRNPPAHAEELGHA